MYNTLSNVFLKSLVNLSSVFKSWRQCEVLLLQVKRDTTAEVHLFEINISRKMELPQKALCLQRGVVKLKSFFKLTFPTL